MSGVVIHLLPENQSPCGGIKVHYQLASISRELAVPSYIAFPKIGKLPHITWFKHHIPEISYQQAMELLHTTYVKDNAILIGYEDPTPLHFFDGVNRLSKTAKLHKVAYIQGNIYYDNSNPDYKGIDIIYSSKWNQLMGKTPGPIISPYISKFPYTHKQLNTDKYTVLVTQRKGGKGAWEILESLLPEEVRSRLVVNIVPDMPEAEFFQQIVNSHIVFAHSYPEGLGLVPAEAMSVGRLVIGLTGGGGGDYMREDINCIISPDGDYQRLADKLIAFFSSVNFERIYYNLVREGKVTVSRMFDRKSTVKQYKRLLEHYGIIKST
jgi:hypothetical protein